MIAGCFIGEMLKIRDRIKRRPGPIEHPSDTAEVDCGGGRPPAQGGEKKARLNAELHTANVTIQALTLALAHHRPSASAPRPRRSRPNSATCSRKRGKRIWPSWKPWSTRQGRNALAPAASHCPATSNAWRACTSRTHAPAAGAVAIWSRSASCTATLPSAPAPPWINTRIPRSSWAVSIKALQAATPGMGKAAAVANDTVRGFSATCAASTAT
ncbi:hypothetical protein ACFDR9_001989 [Janthinobacterium sp. CG_23.3]